MGNNKYAMQTATAAPEHPVSGNEVTRLPAEAELRCGVIISNSDIRIDGKFFGKILTKGKVILGEAAVFKGEIVCFNADIFGNFDGNIFVGNTISLKDKSILKGNVNTQKLCVESGAAFNGTNKTLLAEEFDKIAKDFETAVNKEYPSEFTRPAVQPQTDKK